MGLDKVGRPRPGGQNDTNDCISLPEMNENTEIPSNLLVYHKWYFAHTHTHTHPDTTWAM